MAWIEVHQSLPTHRKTLALADELNIEPVHAVGHLTCLWLWALDNAPDGSLANISPRTLARAAQWRKEPQVFADALAASGLVNEDRSIHDWDDYAGRLIERRKRDADRKRTERSTPPDQPPHSNGHVADVHELSGGHPSDIPTDVPPTSNASRARVNRTQPYPTVPNKTGDVEETALAVLSASADEPIPIEKISDARSEEIDLVYAHYQAHVQPNSRLCPRKKIAARLKRFSAAQLLEGIDHFAADEWRMNNNVSGYGADWFFASDAQAEKWLLLRPRGPTAPIVEDVDLESAPPGGERTLRPCSRCNNTRRVAVGQTLCDTCQDIVAAGISQRGAA